MQDRLNANVAPRQVSAWYELVRKKIDFGTYVFHLAWLVSCGGACVRWCVCVER